MQSYQLNPFDYGFICYDQWDAVYEPVIALRSIDNGDGTFSSEEYQTDEMKCVREAGDRYSLRDGEFNKFLLAGLFATTDARLSALESANL